MDVTIVDTLIELVAERPTIWDKRNKSHSSRLAVEKCWKEIGAALDVDENVLRKKWKYLRDQFCVELGKVHTSTTGASKWRHFKALEFLRETVTPRIYGKEDDEYRDADQEDSDIEVDEQSSSDYFERLSPKNEGKKKIKQENSKKKKKARASVQDNDSVYDKYVFEGEDEHLHFFKSVLPHVRKIPEAKLLSFRSRMQTLVEDFAYGSNSTSTEFVPEFPIKGSPPRYSSEACDPIDTSG